MVGTLERKLPNELMSRPKGILDEDHRQIEHHLEVVAWMLESINTQGKLQLSQGRALQLALDYFAREAHWHTRDEEMSLFPRIREAEDERLNKSLNSLADLEQEHVDTLKLHAELDKLGRGVLQQEKLTASVRTKMGKILTKLQEMYRQHMVIEDREVFPRAAEVLGYKVMKKIDGEIKARRQEN